MVFVKIKKIKKYCGTVYAHSIDVAKSEVVDIELPRKIKGRVHQDGRLVGVAGPVEDVGQADECNILLVAVRTVSFTVIIVSLTVMTANTATATHPLFHEAGIGLYKNLCLSAAPN